MINLEKAFRTASTVEAKAEVIVQYLTEAGLSPDQMLEVLKMARERIEPKPASKTLLERLKESISTKTPEEVKALWDSGNHWDEPSPGDEYFPDRPEFKAHIERIEQERAQGKMIL